MPEVSDNTWNSNESLSRISMRRLIEDSELLQSIATKLDLQLSTGQFIEASETMSMIEAVIVHLEASCSTLNFVIEKFEDN